MPVVATVKPELLSWARERAALDQETLARLLKVKDPTEVQKWEQTGEIRFTMLEKIAKRAYIPIGYLFLNTPPNVRLPIPDFRRSPTAHGQRSVSGELLDTVHLCQFRQDWYENKSIENLSDQLGFVGSFTVQSQPTDIARAIRSLLNIDNRTFRSLDNWESALRVFIEKIDQSGILVMRSGIVGNNTHRKLLVSEFRGFTLSSRYSPLIFININDAKAAQMFTLAHELAHVWLGQSGVSNIYFSQNDNIETLCNQVASEVLVPNDDFINDWHPNGNILYEVKRLTRIYKVSSLVILIKALQNKYVDQNTFENLYDQERLEGQRPRSETSGGDFYLTQGVRLSKRFINAVVQDAFEGKTTYVEAFQLLGVKKSATFKRMADMVLTIN